MKIFCTYRVTRNGVELVSVPVEVGLLMGRSSEVGPGRSVGIVTDYGLDGPVIEINEMW
jgi:hypothetical protein